jgi:hypothetical protein
MNNILHHPKFTPMKTIKTVAAFALALIFTMPLFAQPKQGDGKEKVEALKIAFITEKLSLPPDQAQKFWPTYNQFNDEMKQLRQTYKPTPDAPLTADQTIEFDQKKLDLKKKYKAQFEAILGKDKVNTLYSLEDEFRRKMKELHDQRHSGPPAGAGPRKP